MTLRTRDRLVKLLRKRGLQITDTIETALDSFLIEVREQQVARAEEAADDDEDEDDEVEEGDEDDADDDDEDDDDEDDDDEDDAVDAEEGDAKTVGTDTWSEDQDDTEPGAATKGKSKKPGKSSAAKPVEPESDEEDEKERTLVQEVTCPHCGERIPLVLDLSGGDQDDIQDCEVCCSPIRVTYTVVQGSLGALSIEAS